MHRTKGGKRVLARVCGFASRIISAVISGTTSLSLCQQWIVCLCTWQSVNELACTFAFASVCLSVCLIVCLSVALLSVCLCVYVLICQSISCSSLCW